MSKILLLIVFIVVWVVVEKLFHKLIGFEKPTDTLQRWTYDLPAYTFGFILGSFFM